MATEGQRLRQRGNRLAKTADRLSARFARQLAQVLRELERTVSGLMLPGAPTSAVIQAAEAQALRTQIGAALVQAGYGDLVSAAVGQPFNRVADLVAAMRLLPAVPTAAAQIAAVRTIHLAELLGEGQRLTESLQRAAVRGVVGTTPRRRLLSDLARTIDRSEAQIATLYDTTVSIYGREVEAASATPGKATRFVYLGPVDDKTRPWCLQYVGRVLNRQEIDGLDNGQIGPVFLTGGGWRCRHQWTEISQASELVSLHKSKGRLPEMQADIADQRRQRKKAA